MKWQRYNWSCGSATLSNAFRALGKRVSEKTIMKYSGTSRESGTNEEGMVKAIISLGYNYERFEERTFKEASKWLKEKLEEGKPCIILIDNYGHYVLVFGILGDKFMLFDSYGKWNNAKKENGILILSEKRLKKMWYNSSENLYFGIALKK